MEKLPTQDDSPWQTHNTRSVYDNAWIAISESQVTTPAGTPGIYGVVHFKNRAVGVIPVDDEGYTYLVGQYRYTLASYEWEIPAGGCPEGESPEETARRELQEETGLIASQLTPLLDGMALSNSVSDERAYVFLAEGLSQEQAAPEETEDLQIIRIPLQEAIDRVLSGEITDSMSVAGLLRVALDHRSP